MYFVSSNRNFLGDLRLNLLSGRAEQERAWALLRTYLMLSREKGRYCNFHIRYIFIFIVRLLNFKFKTECIVKYEVTLHKFHSSQGMQYQFQKAESKMCLHGLGMVFILIQTDFPNYVH